MPPSDFFKAFLAGKAPRNVRMIAARGLAPVPAGEMLHILVILSGDPDAGIASQASATLSQWSDEEAVPQLRAGGCAPEVLEYFARERTSGAVRAAVVANASAPADVIAGLAAEVPGDLLERILDNRVRLLEAPAILQRIKLNPAATPQILRQVLEIEEEFFSGKRQEYSVESGGAASELPEEGPPEELAEALQLPEDLELEGLPIDPEARESALSERIARLTPRQKIQLALMGTREARAVLIRDPSRQISLSVLESPKLSDGEVEGYASMRNVSDEVLRQIGNSKEWTRKYGVVHALVKNPKTPPMIAQRMLPRLTARDLSLLVRDRGIPEIVRRGAERMLKQRAASRQVM
jgi:hypothetical protein